jgi:uncharacterized protein YcaQ
MSNNILKTLGANTANSEEREHLDFYASDPQALELLLEQETFNNHILEPACGDGVLSEVLKKHGYQVDSYDIVNRGYDQPIMNFLTEYPQTLYKGDIITNPPYSHALEFMRKALDITPTGNKIAMLLRVLFLEGKKRGEFFKEHPPHTIYIFRGRTTCYKNNDKTNHKQGAQAYAWFVWQKGFKGDPIIKWIN